jgi:hypothetical protein
MRSRLLLAASAASLLALGACAGADNATAPRHFDPNVKRWDMSPGPGGTCRAGYHVATRADGVQVCEED